MVSDDYDPSLFQALPDDVLAIVSQSLLPRDLCNLGLCCRSLYALAQSEKVWLTQCDALGVIHHKDLIEWRKGVSSYKALFRFLFRVQPLIGIWVHQNPELGNVVYVMPGFVSVVGCRIIPQELGPLGIEDGPILWAPVFEIFGDFDGVASFFLHGRERGVDYVYPGSLKHVDRKCNVLLLEVEPRLQKNGGKLAHSKSFVQYSYSSKICRSDSALLRSQRVLEGNDTKVPFSRLSFSDRRKLLEVVTSRLRQKVPDLANGPLFACLRDDNENFRKDMLLLNERRSLIFHMQSCEFGEEHSDLCLEIPSDLTQLGLSEIRKSLDQSSSAINSFSSDNAHGQCAKKKTLGGYFRYGIKQILGKSISFNGSHAVLRNSSSSSESKHAQLLEFLRSGDMMGLTLNASTVKLSSYRAWPNMHDSRFALYKLPLMLPKPDQEYAGLWGGTFGWPPGKPTEDKPGKALFLLMLSYEESEGQRLLIATKILEGTHYVLHPNGSAMFIANIDQPSPDPFPWSSDANSLPVTTDHAFVGEGIANGYGFRYPGAKPGSLYVLHNGLIAFIWKESRAVLTLQRLNLQDLLKKGERVPALPAITNFTHLTKSYSNVFAGFSNASNGPLSPRQKQT